MGAQNSRGMIQGQPWACGSPFVLRSEPVSQEILPFLIQMGTPKGVLLSFILPALLSQGVFPETRKTPQNFRISTGSGGAHWEAPFPIFPHFAGSGERISQESTSCPVQPPGCPSILLVSTGDPVAPAGRAGGDFPASPRGSCSCQKWDTAPSREQGRS